MIDEPRQIALRDDFLSTGDYEIQNALLFSMVRRVLPVERTTAPGASRRQATYKYFLPNEDGIMEEVCKLTLQNALGVTPNRIRSIQERISTGRLIVQDRKGSHTKRPHTITQNVRNDIVNHIRPFPSELSHYTRNVRK